jgi:branched-chain amino acid transport system substrate-binding protein
MMQSMMRRVRGLAAVAAVFALALAPGQAPAQQPSGDPIKIGFSMALTGGLAGAGKAALIAMQIWAEDTNAAGGLLGRPVELVYYDDHTNPSDVPGIYTKLINVDQVDLVVSGYASNMIVPAIPIVMRRGMVFPALFGLGLNDEFQYDKYFQIMPTGVDAKRALSRPFIDIAVERDLKTVAIVGADAEFSRNAMDGARDNANEHGLEIVYDNTYPPNTSDFSPIVRAIRATNPDVLFIGSYPPDSAGLIRAMHEVGIDAKLIGGGMVGLQFASLQTALGPLLNGIVNFDFWAPEPTLQFEGIEAFLVKYQERAEGEGVDPLGHYLPPYAYAYLEILGQAVEAVGEIDQDAIAQYIHDNKFETVVGEVEFGENGEWAEPRVLMIQFQNIEDNNLEQFAGPGKRVVIKPDEWQSGDLIFPYGEARK